MVGSEVRLALGGDLELSLSLPYERLQVDWQMDLVIVVVAEHFIAETLSIGKDAFILRLKRLNHVFIVFEAVVDVTIESFLQLSILGLADTFQREFDFIYNLSIVHFDKVDGHILYRLSSHAIFAV